MAKIVRYKRGRPPGPWLHRPHEMRPAERRGFAPYIAALIFGGIVTAGYAAFTGVGDSAADRDRASCDIKGNINLRGERIYHLPRQEYYSRTIINPLAGERWFCSEGEAVAAGWRRSRL